MRAVICAVCCAVCWCSAHNSNANFIHHPEDPPPVMVDPVVVEDDPLPIQERDPSGSASVQSTPLQLPTIQSTSDLLRGIPGVQTRITGGGLGRATTVSLRGAAHQQTLVLLDDVPLNPALGGGADLSLLPLAATGKIEVYRGGSAIFGANAVGGTLRFVSHSPTEDPFVRMSAGVGSFQTGFVSGLFSGSTSSLGWVGAVSLIQSQGEFPFVDANGNARTRENNALRVGQASLVVSADDSAGNTWTVIEHFGGSRRGSPGVEQFPSRLATEETATNTAALRIQSDNVGTSSVTQVSQLWHRYDRFHYWDPVPFVPPAVDNSTVSHAIGLFSQWDAHLNTWWLLQARIEGTAEWANVVRSGRSQHPSRLTSGFSIVSELELVDSTLLLVASGRLEVAEGLAPVPLGKIGLAVYPHKSVVFSANTSRAYRAPSFSELFYDSGGVRGNPALRPEDAWSVDFTAEWNHDLLQLRATGFFLDIANLVIFLPKTAFVIQADDSKHARSLGVEAECTFAPWSFLKWYTSYTLTDARFVDTGRRLPGRSVHQIYSKITLDEHYVSFSVDVHWQSDMTLDRFEQLREEGRWTMGATMHGRPTPWLTLSVSATNLLDKRDAVDSLQQPLSGLSLVGATTVIL